MEQPAAGYEPGHDKGRMHGTFCLGRGKDRTFHTAGQRRKTGVVPAGTALKNEEYRCPEHFIWEKTKIIEGKDFTGEEMEDSIAKMIREVNGSWN